MAEELDPQQFGRWETPRELTDPERHMYPYSWYEEMRENQPVRFDETRQVWDVFRYDDVERVAAKYEEFSSEGAGIFDLLYDDESDHVEPEIVSLDPPEHTAIRNTVEDHFRPRNFEKYRPEMERRASELLDDAVADGPDFDFMREVAWQYPMIIIADMLGVPIDRREEFKEWSDVLVAAPSDMDVSGRQELFDLRMDTMSEMSAFFEEMVEARRTEDEPRDDLFSTILDTDLSEEGTIKFFDFLLLAGNITTTKLLSNAIWTFIEEDAFADLHSGEMSLEDAIEEVLRYRSPVKVVTRKTAQEVNVQGQTIPEGEVVVGWLAAANRDPRVFDDPDSFIPSRDNRAHMAFGKGVHTCLGSSLARLEAKVMLQEFVDRFADAELLTDQLEPFISRSTYGMTSLPIRVDPRT